ncbi:MAG: DapH/DapD/GlmU-related protein [Candidatus Parcubacteria bacterium]|nr:DapH/DapD/GlmU-related protein [Candidatus Parcubacteria bacterium]
MKKFWHHKTAEIASGAKIGPRTMIWHNSQVQKDAIVGKNCILGHNCFVASGARLGNNVKLESNIDVWDLINLENYVFVGPSVVFTNDLTPRAKYPKVKYNKYGHWLPTTIKEGASIGANATIICGNTVGRWAMVGAGAVVSRDVADYAIVVGVPAKAIGWVCECGNKLNFKKGLAKCSFCRKEYKIKNNQVKKI